MIEKKVPKDIRVYKTKVLGPFTTRQITCVAIAAVVDILVYKLFFSGTEISPKAMIIILMIVDLPIFAFIIEPFGMKMEVFLKSVILKKMLYPPKRKMRNEIDKIPKISEEEYRRSQKLLKKRLKEHPEWRRYE